MSSQIATIHLHSSISKQTIAEITEIGVEKAAADFDFNIYEAPTITTPGAAPITALNNLNREIASTPDVSIFTDSVISAKGSLLSRTSSNTIGARGILRFILKRDEDYLLEAINNGGVLSDFFVKATITEIPDDD